MLVQAVLPALIVRVTAALHIVRPAQGDSEELAPALPAPLLTLASFQLAKDFPLGLARKVRLDTQIMVERDFYH